jgi:hypothetical protein
MRKELVIPTILLIFCFSTFVFGQIEKKAVEDGKLAEVFLIDKDKPSFYITFEKSGKVPALFKNESNERYFLRVRNNTNGSISFCKFNVPGEYGEIGLKYSVGKIKSFGISSENYDEKIPSVKSNSAQKDVFVQPKQNLELQAYDTPQGYSEGDACLTHELGAGKSVLFSVPKEHLHNKSSTFYLEIKFKFEWEKESPILGFHPLHLVTFSYYSLPSSERN